MSEKSDLVLLQELLTLISYASAIGADALHECGGSRRLVQWLTEAATGFAQASVSRAILDQVELTDEWREAIRRALRGSECI